MRKAVTKETTTAIRPHPTAYWAIGQNLFKTFLKPVKTLVYLAKQEDAHRGPVIDPVELALPLPSVPSYSEDRDCQSILILISKSNYYHLFPKDSGL